MKVSQQQLLYNHLKQQVISGEVYLLCTHQHPVFIITLYNLHSPKAQYGVTSVPEEQKNYLDIKSIFPTVCDNVIKML